MSRNVPHLALGVHYRVDLGRGQTRCFAAIVTDVQPPACRTGHADCVSLYVLPPHAFAAPQRGRLEHVVHKPDEADGWHFDWECLDFSKPLPGNGNADVHARR